MTERKKLNSFIGQTIIEKREINSSITPPKVPSNSNILKTYL